MIAPVETLLKGAPEREAVDSMRGYSYQILRSLEAWIGLAEGEVLILEGAEDFDRIAGDAATTEQVKDTAGSGNVTLRSQAVLEAIGNYWDHAERNSDITIRFRFLTTSGVGKERSRPFGFDESGLEAWRRIRTAPTTAVSHGMASGIQSFLKDQDALPGQMRDWLATATPEAFIERIVLPIEWVTRWPDWRELRATVLAKLVELAEKRGIGSEDAARALDALHTEAWRVATTKTSRSLRRGDLLIILDRAGTTAVPTQQWLSIIGTLSGAPSNAPPVLAAPEPFGIAPRRPSRRHPRPALENSIRVALDRGTVLIHGATGMGKTGLAAAVIGATRPTAWVDLRDVPASVAASRLDALAARLHQIHQAHDVVLDDLPASGDARTLETALGRVRTVQDDLGGSLLVTYPDRLPGRIAAQLSLKATETFAAPDFDEGDIEGYLLANGCSAETAQAWSRILRASTRGHPQFVDARLAALVDAGFPKPNIAELVAPRPEILDVRGEARRLVAALPADDRELLSRASLLLGRTPRARFMTIAAISPPIAEPGDVIDRVTGPWLERTDNDDLRPSPLLSNLGTDTRGPDWAAAIHRGIAYSFLTPKGLLASDIFEIATHAMLGGTAAPLVHLIPSLLRASDEVWKQVAETASMLTLFGVGDATGLPFSDPNEVAAFRVLQLRIAIVAGDRDQVGAIVERSLAEFDAFDLSQNPAPRLFELLFLWQSLQEPGDLRLADRLRLFLRFVETGERLSVSLEALKECAAPDDAELDWPDLVAFGPMTLIPAVNDVDSLDELLDLVETMDATKRTQALAGYGGEAEAAALALDRVWLGEASRTEPRWDRLATALRRTLALSSDAKVATLAGAAAPLLVRVIDENTRDSEAAVVIADTLIAKLGRPPQVLGAKARVLWRRGDYPEALDLYDEAIPRLALGSAWKTDLLRDAGVAAGKSSDWALSADRLTEALKSLPADEPCVRRVGILFDLACALHLAGRTRDAVDRLGEAVALLSEVGQEPPPEPLISVRQLGSQVMKTIGAELGQSAAWNRDQIPLTRLFGSASALEQLTWGDQQPAPLDIILLVMAELDLLMPEHPAIAARIAPRLRASSNLLAQSTQGDTLTRLAIRTLEVAHGAEDSIREVRALMIGAGARRTGCDVAEVHYEEAPTEIAPDWQEFVKYRLLARVVAMVAQGRAQDIPVDVWLKAMPNGGGLSDVIAMLEDLRRLIDGTTVAADRLYRGNATWGQHLLAALMVPVQAHVGPDQLFVCHAIAARYLHQAKLGEFVGAPFAELVTAAWLDRCETPALLMTPRLSVQAIRRAATTTDVGWSRTLAVLDAGRHAVSASTAASAQECLDALRQGMAAPPSSTS